MATKGVARYSIAYGLEGCYMPDYQGGCFAAYTRKELAERIREELRMLEMPASLFNKVGIEKLWGFIKRNGSSSAHFNLHHKGYVLSFGGLTEEEYEQLEAMEEQS